VDGFERFYREERPRVLAACVALVGQLDLAREATDEAFARACARWPRVQAMGSPGGWVQTVALNQLRRSLRRRPKALTGVDEKVAFDEYALPDRALWAAVADLPERQRTAVVLRYVHDLPAEQIAAAMGIAVGTVGPTLTAAQRRLRAALDGPVTNPEEHAHG
jgi:RNA polymerase sigma-70 factor (ECF subfamily)